MPYDKHFFVCTNKRADGTGCGHLGGESICKTAKKNIADPSQSFRINASGCLGHCNAGPVLVVYPDAVWYSYFDYLDVEAIVTAHLRGVQGPHDLVITDVTF